MKFNKIVTVTALATTLFSLSSCDDFLDRKPISSVTPESYFTNESHLSAYAIGMYENIPNSSPNGWINNDNNTDCQTAPDASNLYAPGEYKVGATGGSWEFTEIRKCNYFFSRVIPKYEAGKIAGSDDLIRHYIGEMHFLRACVYFQKLLALGDFPILTGVFSDNKEELAAACVRQPRNKVARFILCDLDSALMYLKEVPPRTNNKTQITKDVVVHLKSRVALFEGTWLKYHKGTARVPGGPGWPGAATHPNFSIDIDSEINFFLDEAMKSAKIVADKYPLVNNTKGVPQPAEAPTPFTTGNPYFEMFGDVDMSKYSEVILWREYKLNVVTNNISRGFQEDNGTVGVTRGAVENFLMADGKPIYSSSYAYNDDYIRSVKQNRDNRLYLFLKEPGQYNLWVNRGSGTHELNPIEIYPWITGARNGREGKMTTGYSVRKYQNPDAIHAVNFGSGIAHLVFRSAEAYLNYIEASYERTGRLDETARTYWQALRTRAGLPADPQVTISSTVISKEASNDWGAYSSGSLLTDPTLYSIRRERRSEFFSEALRMDDLRRWASFSQMKTTPYVIEGFKLWGPMQEWYKDNGVSYLKYGSSSNDNNVSAPSDGKYLRPYRANSNNIVYNGYKWNDAHYLEPISTIHFTASASDPTNIETSPIYQNPGWPKESGQGAHK